MNAVDFQPKDTERCIRGDSVSSAGQLSTALLQTAVIIPAQNEEASIGLVLEELPAVGRVFVVDNGSTDQTAAVAAAAGAEIVKEAVPGYGRACLAGIAALNGVGGTDRIRYVAFVDGDYSDHAYLLGRLLAPIVEGQADFVLGSRMLGEMEPGAMPPQARWGNRLACFLMNLIWRTDYTDLGPFRVIERGCLESLGMADLNFGWTVEMQVKAAGAGLTAIEIPVPYRRRVGVSKISGTLSGTVRAGYKILATIGKYAWMTDFGWKRRRQR